MSKKGLGKGLASLIPETPVATATMSMEKAAVKKEVGTGVTLLMIDEIEPNPDQPRKIFAEAPLAELADSIKTYGLIQPLVVSAGKGGRYRLLAGERRLRACRLAGVREVPVVVRKASEQEELEVSIIENVQRQDLTPLEEAKAYQRLSQEFGLKQSEIAARVGKSREVVANKMRLLNLPKEAQEALEKGIISESHARTILSIEGDKAKAKVLAEVLKDKLTVREVERVSQKKPAGWQASKSVEYVEMEEKLRDFLGTKVEVKPRKKGGRIEIDFYSEEELYSVVESLVGPLD